MGPKSPPGTRGVKPAGSVPFWVVTDIRPVRGSRTLRSKRPPKASEEPHSSVLKSFLEGWTCGHRGMGLSHTILVTTGLWLFSHRME